MDSRIEKTISRWRESQGLNPSVINTSPLGGGCINDVVVCTFSGGNQLVVKSNPGKPKSFFEIELKGLRELAKVKAIRVPEVYDLIQIDSNHFVLLMEYIESASKASDYDELFGSQLAELHKKSSSEQFGFSEDNLLGATPQINSWKKDWKEFWITNRVEPQIKWASDKGYFNNSDLKLADKFIKVVDGLLPLKCKPCLIHGDLWSGNIMTDNAGKPVIIDPAVYYAHHEAEFGMIQLFGQQSSRFYQAYESTMPFEEGYKERFEIYKWYHVINHLNLFGTSYHSQCISIMKRFC